MADEQDNFSLDEFFDRDPLQRTTVELEAIIEHFRKGRTAFNVAAASGTKAPTKKATAKVAAGMALTSKLGIEAGELDL